MAELDRSFWQGFDEEAVEITPVHATRQRRFGLSVARRYSMVWKCQSSCSSGEVLSCESCQQHLESGQTTMQSRQQSWDCVILLSARRNLILASSVVMLTSASGL